MQLFSIHLLIKLPNITMELFEKNESDGTWVSYVYDTFGNLTETATLLGTTRYTYDVMGNMTSVTNPLGVTTNLYL